VTLSRRQTSVPIYIKFETRDYVGDTFFSPKLSSIRPGDFALTPIYPKYTPKAFECLLQFFQFFQAPIEKGVLPIFALNTSYDVVLRKEVPFGGEKNEFQNLADCTRSHGSVRVL